MVLGVAGAADRLERERDDALVGEASASADEGVEVVLAQTLEQCVRSLLHHVRVGPVGSGTSAGTACCAVKFG